MTLKKKSEINILSKRKTFLNKPEYVRIGDKKYKINTDFRIAIRCNDIAMDPKIGDYEKALAIIYILFGEEGLNNESDYDELLRLGQKYLNLGKDLEDSKEEPDMDFTQDMNYIEASFMSDYQIDLPNTKMHWWTFYNLINGLSNSEFGNCCVLNRIRNLRAYDVSQIKDRKERERIVKAKKQVVLRKNEPVLSKEQQESVRELEKLIKQGFLH